MWLGVKKEVRPAKGAQGKKMEAKVVPAKRQHAKKDTASVSFFEHTHRRCTSWSQSMQQHVVCVVLLSCCVRRMRVVHRKRGRRRRRRARCGSGGKRSGCQRGSSGGHWSIVYVGGRGRRVKMCLLRSYSMCD